MFYTTTPIDRVRRVRAAAVLQADFVGLASLILPLPLVETRRAQTMATDGRKVFVNPDFVDTLSDAEILGVLMHEALHIALGHHVRRDPSWSPMLWNVATDYVINYQLKNADVGDMQLPGFVLYDEKYDSTWSAEAVLRDIMQNATVIEIPMIGGGTCQVGGNQGASPSNSPEGDEQGEQGDEQGQGGSKPGEEGGQAGGGGSAQGQDSKSEPDGGLPDGWAVAGEVWDAPPEVDRDQEMEEIKQALHDAALLEKAIGKGKGGFLSTITDGYGDPEEWDWISSLLRQVYNPEHTWSRPNRRHLHRGVYLPGRNIEMGVLHICEDTSGSVGQIERAYFLTNVREIARSVGVHTIKICYVDYGVHRYEDGSAWQVIRLNEGDEVVMKTMGGGGTSFDPVFNLIEDEEEEVQCLIYMTDGWGSVSVAEPDYPVIWLTTGKSPQFNGPDGEFGEIIDVSDKLVGVA